MKSIAIVQSNYLPWKGYFDLIDQVDEFVILDQVQYTRRDWRNRNKIKTDKGTQWLTIPVHSKGNYLARINEVEVFPDWDRNHWNTIKLFYKKASFYDMYSERLKELFQKASTFSLLSDINVFFIKELNKLLNIHTVISMAPDRCMTFEKSRRLLEICKDRGANVYLSGPAAKSYLDESLFLSEDIEVQWMNYENYAIYNQLYPPFQHQVSIIDMLLNVGPDTIQCIREKKP
ncbi:MAG: hypothetical protein CSA81_08945 [Acidobacteria bacterium]|nr:MAG: hypothetical protein CSA81_08945 [Acidobacteriota bacterium]